MSTRRRKILRGQSRRCGHILICSSAHRHSTDDRAEPTLPRRQRVVREQVTMRVARVRLRRRADIERVLHFKVGHPRPQRSRRQTSRSSHGSVLTGPSSSGASEPARRHPVPTAASRQTPVRSLLYVLRVCQRRWLLPLLQLLQAQCVRLLLELLVWDRSAPPAACTAGTVSTDGMTDGSTPTVLPVSGYCTL